MDNDRQAFIASFSAFQASLEKINAEIGESYKPIIKSVTEMQKQYEFIFAPFQLFAKQLSASMLETLNNDSFQQQMHRLQDNLSSLTIALQGITIHEDYVAVPEVLIPKDFQYEEVPYNLETVTGHCADKSPDVKRLSLSDALNIINMVICILTMLLAPFYNYAIDGTLSEKDDTEAVSPMTEEQAQHMLEYLSELTDSQQAILNALEASGESVQRTDSCSYDIRPRSATPDSAWSEDDESSPTSADEPGSSE